jgi:hypothetical protein
MGKTVVKKIRFSEIEIRRIEKAALAEELSFSEYLRLHIRKGVPQHQELREFISNITKEINQIGKRVNQIAIHSNQGIMNSEDKIRMFGYLKEVALKLDEAIEFEEK